MPDAVIEADYVIVGAGACGMSFADVVLTESDYSVAIVDEHVQPGGHWNDAYPFVRLHQPSAFYGVNSRPLGRLQRDTSGTNAGFYELATGQQVLTYFDEVMREQFLPTRRVAYLPMSDYLSDGTAVSAPTGKRTTLVARRRVVDAHYLGSEVPSVHTPAFDVGPDADFVPVNALARLSRPHPEYVILGAGKTGVDACLWLLEQGVGPEAITWVRPHDLWFCDRAQWQPDRSVLRFAADLVEVAAQTNGATDFLDRLERANVLVRIDPTFWPTKFRGATMTRAEIDQARRVERVVRLGHVTSVERQLVQLSEGALPIDAEALIVDCTAEGIRYRPPVPIFQGDRITLQYAQFTGHPTYSASLIARTELALDSDDTKNDVCPPIPMSGEADQFLASVLIGLQSMGKQNAIPEIAQWSQSARLNGLSWALKDMEDPEAQADLGRLFTALEPALANIRSVLGEVAASR